MKNVEYLLQHSVPLTAVWLEWNSDDESDFWEVWAKDSEGCIDSDVCIDAFKVDEKTTNDRSAALVQWLDSEHTERDDDPLLSHRKKKITNAEWLIQQGLKFSDLTISRNSDWGFDIKCKGKKIGEYKKYDLPYPMIYLFEWLDQLHVDQPLITGEERAYLEAVCEPVRNRIVSIRKNYTTDEDGVSEPKENIIVELKDLYHPDQTPYDMFLYTFKAGAQFKGMEQDTGYTPKDLGMYVPKKEAD